MRFCKIWGERTFNVKRFTSFKLNNELEPVTRISVLFSQNECLAEVITNFKLIKPILCTGKSGKQQ